MAFLEQFSDEERELIVSLPYRTGLWVSRIDDTGGVKADSKELAELEVIIAEKSKGMFESAFVHEVMFEIDKRQPDWKVWAEKPDTVIDDCKKVVVLISGKLSEKDVDAYRANLMALGLNVAKAFREFGVDDSLPVKLLTQLKLTMEALLRILKRDKSYDTESVFNVSFEEDVALSKLSKALHEGMS